MARLRRRTRPESVRRCPQCGSSRLVFEAGLITGQVYHCLACDYVGAFVIEEDLPETGEPSAAPSSAPDPHADR